MNKSNLIKQRFINFIFLLFCSITFLNAQKISDETKKRWSDPFVQQRIADGIRLNRMGNFTIKFENEKGEVVEVEQLIVNQIKHEFLFGSNAFMNKGYPTDEENEKYEKTFASLFNFATIPFYWNALEPKEGELRFSKDSKPVFRRPAPDLVLEFCNKYDITPKGHTLVWDDKWFFIPDWLEKNKDIREKALAKRIDQIAERYNDKINYWDVANEPSDRRRDVIMPKDFFFKGFKEAERVFSGNNKFIINPTSNLWERSLVEYGAAQYSHDYLVVENMILKKAKVDIVGMQMHFLTEDIWNKTVKGEVFTPERILYVLDLFSEFNLPIHITELSVPNYPVGPIGEENQAFIAENFYKLLFSYPNVEAITWWNLVNKSGAQINAETGQQTNTTSNPWEAAYDLSGLLNRDFTPKKSFKVLDRLINKEWRTNLTFNEKLSSKRFNCFYGKYNISYKLKGKVYTENISLSKKGESKLTIVVK